MKNLIIGALQKAISKTGDRPFLTDLRLQRDFTYRDLLSSAGIVQAFLKDHHIGCGDCVVYLTTNSCFFFPFFLGCLARGITLVPLNPQTHGKELEQTIRHSRAKAVFYDMEFRDRLPALGPKVRFVGIELDGGPGIVPQGFHRQSAEVTGEYWKDRKEAIIIYTSGTTSQSKGVVLTMRNLLSMANNFVDFYAYQPGQKFFSVLPFYHINAPMITGLACLLGQCHIVLADLYGYKTAKFYWDIVAKHRINVLSLTPSIMASLLELYPAGAKADTSCVEYALVGTAELKEPLWRSFEKRFKVPCCQGYGLTETTTWATMVPRDARKRYDSVGIPFRCEVRIDDHVPLPVEGDFVSGSGEVLIRGDIVMKGYYKNPEDTAKVFSGGWLRTGDIGYMSGGQLVISGRLKNIAKRKGVLIFLNDIDELLRKHPEMLECLTLALPDEILGERIISACVLRGKKEGREHELYDYLKTALSEYKLPDEIVLMAKLPRNELGKISQGTLKKIFSGEIAKNLIAFIERYRISREKISDPVGARAIVQQALLDGSAVSMVGYWGVWKRDVAAAPEIEALDRLKKFLDEANDILGRPLLRMNLILADLHGKNNGVSQQTMDSYFSSIIAECDKRGFDHEMLSAVWKKCGLDYDATTARIQDEMFLKSWEGFTLREQFIEQASRRAESERSSEILAKKYYAMVVAEKAALSEYFKGSLFFTYNNSMSASVLPGLPTVYLHSVKPGVGEKPWFMEG